MFKEKQVIVTDEALCEIAQGNLIAVICVATQFVQRNGLDVDEFWHFVGRKFAPAWAEEARGNVDETARRIARNVISCGAELQSYTGDEEQTTLNFTGWPPAWTEETLGITLEDGGRMCEVFRPIIEWLDLKYAWCQEDDAITIVVCRKTSGNC